MANIKTLKKTINTIAENVITATLLSKNTKLNTNEANTERVINEILEGYEKAIQAINAKLPAKENKKAYYRSLLNNLDEDMENALKKLEKKA